MNKEMVSIIVPTYNNQGTIKRCIESLTKQSYSNVEIIIIDDGSTDKTPEIIDFQSCQDDRIKVIHKKNGGVSSARNTGLDIVKGYYITFCDSDDFFEENAIEKLVGKVGDNELVVSRYNANKEGDVVQPGYYVFEKDTTLEQNEYVLEICKQFKNHYFGVLWNKLYRADIIKENNIIFDTNTSLGEDVIFNLDYAKNISKVNVITDVTVNHILRKDSLTSVNTWYMWKMFEKRVCVLVQLCTDLKVMNSCEHIINETINYYTIAPSLYIASYYKKSEEAIEKYKEIYEEDIVKNSLRSLELSNIVNKYAKKAIKDGNYKKLHRLLKLIILMKKFLKR